MKKKVALSATAIAVLASTVPTHVALVQAAETGNVIYVNSKGLLDNKDFSGEGTQKNPYKQLSTAVEEAKSGDTIIIIGEGYVNDNWGGTPWYIDKDITIKGEGNIPPTVSVRTPGIILGANVTFENVALGLANKTHDAIFANGHELNLINVSRAKGTRQVDLFAGSFYGATKYSAGDNPVINVITNNQFVGTINGESIYSEFGGIYAGSMNTTYDKSAKIKVSNTGSRGILKVAALHSSGAWEAETGDLFEFDEPALPEADPNRLHNYGDVEVTLENINLTVNGNTSPTATTTLKVIGEYYTQVNSNNIDNLELEGTTFAVSQNIFTNGLNQLTLGSNAILDLINWGSGDFNVGTYTGNGGIALSTSGSTLNIQQPVGPDHSLILYLKGYSIPGEYNGMYNKNQTYVTTANPEANIIYYKPEGIDKKYKFYATNSGNRYEWKVAEPQAEPEIPDVGEDEEEEVGLPNITGFNIDPQYETVTKEVDDFKVSPQVTIPFSIETDDELEDYIFLEDYTDLAVTVEGHEVVSHEDESGLSCFYVRDLNMYIYLQPNLESDDLKEQEILVEFKDENGTPVPPKEDTYKIGVSAGSQTLNTTLIIGDGQPDELPPAPGEDGGDGKPDGPTNGSDTDDPEGGDDEKDPDKPVPPVDGEDGGDDGKEPVPDPEQPPTPGNGDGEGGGDGDLDPEPPAPTKPTIQQFTKGSYLYEGPPASELSIPFEVEFDTKPSQPVPFHEIEGTKVVFSGEEFEYRDGRYYNDSQILVLEIRTGDEVGKYTAVLKNVFGTNEIPSGTHSFTLQASDKQAVLDYTVRHIINNLTADVKEKTFKANDFSSSEDPKIYFTFEAETNNEHKELSWYEGFSLTINGEPAVTLIKDGHVYYRIYKENAYAYIDYEEATNSYKLVLVTEDSEGNPAPPKGNKYTIALSYKEGAEPLTFTANVQGEGEPTIPTPPPVVDPDPVDPTPPPVVEPDPELPTPDTTEVTYTLPQGQANQEKTITKAGSILPPHEFVIVPQFVSTPPSINDFLNGLIVTIGGNKAERVGEKYQWKAEGANVSLVIVSTDGNEYKVAFDTVNQSDGSTLDVGEYTATVQYGENNPEATFKLNVESKQVTPTPPPVDPTPPSGGDKEEEKEEPTNPPSGGNTGGDSGSSSGGTSGGNNTGGNSGGSPSGGGSSSGGTPPSGTTPPSGGSGNTGGSSSGGTVTPSQPSTGGGTTLPAPDPKPEKPSEKPPVVDKPTPQPPQQEETKPTTRPTVKPGAISSAVEALEDLATTIKEKVDSLLTEVVEQAKGLVLDLTGDKDDLTSVSTLEVTKEGIFANVDGEKVKFAADLKLEDIDMSKLRITRTDGSPIPYTTDGKGFKIDTHNFSDILITERVVEPFVDVAKDDWFQPYVDEMYNRGITTGTTATSFSPNESITRAQLAALLARTYELKPTGEKPVLTDTADQWYAADVQALVDLGIIKGYGDGTFRSDEPITREHLAIMLQRLAEKLGKDANPVKESNFTDTAKMSAEGKSAVQWAAEQGIINSGQGTAFKPKSDATRAQVAKMLTLFINK